MNGAGAIVRGGLLAAVGGLFAFQAVAQAAALDGQAVGPEGPVPALSVALHRVTSEGGANVDETVTDGDGRFSFAVALDPADSAVYFAATRVDDELFVGPPIRGVPAEPYVIRIGPGAPAVAMGGGGPAAGVGGLATAAPSRDGSNAATLAAFLVIGFVVIGAVGYAIRGTLNAGPDRRRLLLVELAEIDEMLAGAALGDDERVSCEERRAELRARLFGSHG